MGGKPIVIGGASGFWGEASHATTQLLTGGAPDYLIYDYLAEITMSIMARARMADPGKGYAGDFVTDVIEKNATAIAHQGVKIIANAGGVNPRACASAVREVLQKSNTALKVAVVEGDDLMPQIAGLSSHREMFSGEAFPQADKIASANAYLGAAPIAEALKAGADIVITGRCADSSLTLGACLHAFGWQFDDYDRLAQGSLAGHLIECGPQCTGGNFTDWQESGDLANIGYPYVEIADSGAFEIFKPVNTTGIISPASVGEQMLYEIGDPCAYILPDVICDFSHVTFEAAHDNRLYVTGAKGAPPSGSYKVSLTYMDGYRAGYLFQMNGIAARRKAETYAQIGIDRAREKLGRMGATDFSETSIETFGGRPHPDAGEYEEITVKVAARHDDARAIGLFLKEEVGAALATPPGLHFFTGAGRPKPSPVIRLFSFLVDGSTIPASYRLEDAQPVEVPPPPSNKNPDEPQVVPPPPLPDSKKEKMVECRLEDLAWARSGDKGNNANIGIIARKPEFLPHIWHALDEARLARIFAPTLKGGALRFHLPGIHAMNIVLENVLGGGGVASLLSDSQGKSFAQRLLNEKIPVPAGIAKRIAPSKETTP